MVAERLVSQALCWAFALGRRSWPPPWRKGLCRAEKSEIGWGTVDVTAAGLRGPLAELASAPVLHWHGDTFDVPAGCELLAATPLTPHQAFSCGRGQLALQFHAEMDARLMDTWLIGHCCELAQTGNDPRSIRADALRQGEAARAAGQNFMRRWLAEELA